ncbi:hypothetical protein [Emergencia timonensis]|uniref:hypothetical protein n=1 Tax=Emergencia timonensis TaxID=1776384 RepID=UPI001FCB2797|nr:hypothetical protein [Emergencia timonensis]
MGAKKAVYPAGSGSEKSGVPSRKWERKKRCTQPEVGAKNARGASAVVISRCGLLFVYCEGKAGRNASEIRILH